MKNILKINEIPPEEIFEELLKGKEFTLRRIVSPPMDEGDDIWYDQAENEFVLLLQGNASIQYADGRILKLGKGDSLIIPAHCKHRVSYTSSNPIAVWLTIHYKE